MIPKARREGFIWSEVADELVICDLKRNRAHTLNQTLALVWKSCDGQRSIDDISAILQSQLGLPADKRVVVLALDQLNKAHLLENWLTNRTGEGITRSQMIHMIGMATLIPLIESITLPSPAHAASPGGCKGAFSPCSCSSDGICTGSARCPSGTSCVRDENDFCFCG